MEERTIKIIRENERFVEYVITVTTGGFSESITRILPRAQFDQKYRPARTRRWSS